MANDTKAVVNPQLSGICPGDLGLKAGFWDRKKGSKLTFRPIIGWVAVTNYGDSGKRPFAGLVLDNNYPTFASQASFADFVGYFEKSMTPAKAVDFVVKSASDRPLE